ncbi:MAG: hypothetical protein RL434_220 [Pseudomonadota bacterium]|jgi:molybdenum cofactor cytidylyltransferase
MGLAGCAVLLLAAGLSRRFGSADKLLAPWHGRPLLAWSAQHLAAAAPEVKVAVVGPDDAAREALLVEAGFRCVTNPDPAAGMGSSIACGATFLTHILDEDAPGIFLCLGDMPRVSAALIAGLYTTLAEDPEARVVVPSHDGKRGHPVLFSRECLPALALLAGDRGARTVIQAAGSRVREVPWEDESVLLDFDTPADFARGKYSGASPDL